MTPEQAAVCLSAGGVGVVGSWVWAFVSRPKRRTVVRVAQPAEGPAVPSVGVVRGFAWSLVALTDMMLDQEPTAENERTYVDTVRRGVHVYEEITQR